MTRINCIPPAELVNKHLLAEYRELPRIFTLARRASDAPKHYVLGTGHMKFFFDKLLYLVKRQAEIIKELNKRGINTNYVAENLLAHQKCLGGNIPDQLWNDWEPDEAAMAINRARIQERLLTMKGN